MSMFITFTWRWPALSSSPAGALAATGSGKGGAPAQGPWSPAARGEECARLTTERLPSRRAAAEPSRYRAQRRRPQPSAPQLQAAKRRRRHAQRAYACEPHVQAPRALEPASGRWSAKAALIGKPRVQRTASPTTRGGAQQPCLLDDRSPHGATARLSLAWRVDAIVLTCSDPAEPSRGKLVAVLSERTR